MITLCIMYSSNTNQNNSLLKQNFEFTPNLARKLSKDVSIFTVQIHTSESYPVSNPRLSVAPLGAGLLLPLLSGNLL